MSQNATEEKIGYRDILNQKQYMKIIVSNVINRFGDSIDAIAFTWLVYAVTGSASWTTLIFALNQLPTVLLQPFAGTFVEGMRKKHVIVVSDMIRGTVVALLAVLYMLNMVNPLILAIFTLTISSVEAFCLPASTALIPKILEKKYYAFGTSLNSTVSRITELIGMGIAGVLIAGLGVQVAIIIDCVTFFLSGLIVMLVKVDEAKTEKVNAGAQAYFENVKDGFGYIKRKQTVLNFCILAVFANAVLVPLNSLQSAMAVEMFGVGSELLSVFGIAVTAGMGIGTIVFPYLTEKFRPRQIVTCAGMILGIFFASMTLARFTYGNLLQSCILCAVVSFIMGASVSWVVGTLNVQFMKVVEAEYLARAAAIFNASAAAAAPVMSFFISAVLLKVSIAELFLWCGIACVIVFAGVGILKVRLEEEPQDLEQEKVVDC